ncbi:MAG: CAAD domain-containing protein [Cyanobacteriota bacterium]
MTAEIAKSTDQVEVKVENSLAELKTEETLPVSKMPSQDSSQEEQWQQFGKTASAFIDNLQRDTADFFNQYQQIFATLGWFLLAVITVKLILAAVDALNDIPFLELILELIGLAYVAWFVFRYLLSAAARQELFNEINSFKEQVLGKAS